MSAHEMAPPPPNCPHDCCYDRAFPEVMEAPFERGLMVREVPRVPWGAGAAARAGVCGAEVMAPCIPHPVDREAPQGFLMHIVPGCAPESLEASLEVAECQCWVHRRCPQAPPIR